MPAPAALPSARSSDPAEYLAVHNSEPPVLVPRPSAPAVCDPAQVVRGGVAAADGAGCVGRLDRAVCPQAAPPGSLLRGGVRPGRRRCGDVCEPGFPGPGVQPAPGLGLAAVTPGDPLVQGQPVIEGG